VIANFVKDVSTGNLTAVFVIILWVSAIASAFVDNITYRHHAAYHRLPEPDHSRG
jgi:Na+/H+ antiporter NhaD/arsenite permease-like protein